MREIDKETCAYRKKHGCRGFLSRFSVFGGRGFWNPVFESNVVSGELEAR
ncbi:MAG: hypothetical protein ACI9UN_004694 [Granulosicoccus sp.]|jgi:hypothetical protein